MRFLLAQDLLYANGIFDFCLNRFGLVLTGGRVFVFMIHMPFYYFDCRDSRHLKHVKMLLQYMFNSSCLRVFSELSASLANPQLPGNAAQPGVRRFHGATSRAQPARPRG